MAQQTLIPPVPSLPTGKVRYEQFLQWLDVVEFYALGGVGNTCCRRGGAKGSIAVWCWRVCGRGWSGCGSRRRR